MKQEKRTFHGVEISSYGVANGYVDYRAMAEVVNAELYDIHAEDSDDWELVNGEDIYYYDSEGNIYDEKTSMERVAELGEMIEHAEEGQDVSKWEKDIELLSYEGEPVNIYDYYRVSEEGARILMEESDEIVYYNSDLDVYVWGVCHCGTSWSLVLTTTPIPEQDAA